MTNTPTIAILIPCHNEALTIEEMVTQFKATLPQATIYVYDNNSTDDTAKIALNAGAQVKSVPVKGKGNVVRQMFADIVADIYIMIDGDATYDISAAPLLIETFNAQHLDMLVAARVPSTKDAHRFGHAFGNKFLTQIARLLFKCPLTDLLSGYRVFSKNFVKQFPAKSNEFEVETEMSIYAQVNNFRVSELPAPYFSRPANSSSKLKTFSDGFKILKLMLCHFLRDRLISKAC